MLKHLAAIYLVVAIISPLLAVDERGNALPRRFSAGIESSLLAHNEEGLDKSKGEYSVSYTTFGGSLIARYEFPDFYIQGGIGAMRMLSLTVNTIKVDMSNRRQWHFPALYAHAYFKVFSFFNLGLGLTHLTEATVYVDGAPVPESSYNQIFADAAVQFTPRLTENLTMTIGGVLGLNLIPGRQHTYSVGDLLHLRVQLNLGVLYALF